MASTTAFRDAQPGGFLAVLVAAYRFTVDVLREAIRMRQQMGLRHGHWD